MLSSAFFFGAAKWLFFLRALSSVFGTRPRNLRKAQLLVALAHLKSLSFSALAVNAMVATDRLFNEVGGPRILSFSYWARLASFGCGIGLLFSVFALLFVAEDMPQAMNLLHKQYWWRFIVLPSLMTGAVLCPIDVAVSHGLVRWAARGTSIRCFMALLAALPLAYGLWAVGAGVAASIGMMIFSGFFMPTFILNRIWVAMLDPINSSAVMQIGKSWFSYGLLAASTGLFTFTASFFFLLAGILKCSSARVQKLIAAPLFGVLKASDWLERRQMNYPVGLFAWLGAGVALLCAAVLRLIGA